MTTSRFSALLFALAATASATPLDHRPPPNEAPDVILDHIAFGSCAREAADQPIWDTIVARKPDLWIWLGDNIYGDTHDMMLLAAKWLALASKPGYQNLVATCPVVATWDDHDYGADDSGRDYPEKEHSKQLFLDFFSEPAASPRRTRPGIQTSHLLGPPDKRVQVILLDMRTFRSKQVKRTGKAPYPEIAGYIPDPSPDAAMLGEAQWKWLEGELRKPARLRLIASSSQFVAAYNGHEAWGNYPAERARMIDLIRSTRAEGVVFLSGDTHWADLCLEESEGVYPLFDITSSSINQRAKAGPCHNRIAPVYENPNFGEILIDWEKAALTLAANDLTGKPVIRHELPLSRLTFAAENLVPSAASEAFALTWHTGHGPLTLAAKDGNSWTGTWQQGTCDLKLTNRALEGTWTGEGQGGTCRFTLSRDGQHLLGTYGRGDGPLLLDWSGWK